MKHKIRVGITHGDINGIGYETILKAFSQPTLLELCTPIVYGSDQAAQIHRQQLGLETTWKVVASAESAEEEQLNLVDIAEGAEVKVEFGQPSAEAWAFGTQGSRTRCRRHQQRKDRCCCHLPHQQSKYPKQ